MKIDSLPRRSQAASVLIIVLWIAFGLVSITLYFADSMGFELRASANRIAGAEAEQAVEGAARYINYVLSNLEEPGKMPDPLTYQREAVPVGNAKFWLIGRGHDELAPEVPTFALVDESSKLNLNAPWVGTNLALLPRMTPEMAASICTWKGSNDVGGVGSETYTRLQPPYMCKSSAFETIDELRLIYGMNLELLFGEDANLNGILDPNENDGDAESPLDNRNGRIEPGILEYVTVYSAEPANWTNGMARARVAKNNQKSRDGLAELAKLLNLDSTRAASLRALLGQVNSPLMFYVRSGLTAAEFAQIEGGLRNESLTGLINVNTASAEVLACVPGLDPDTAAALVAYRRSNPDNLQSVAWVAEALNRDTSVIQKAGPYLTGRSYQFTADVAAVGQFGRGFKRTRFVFDTRDGSPRILYRQDLDQLGWALGKQVRDQYAMNKKTQ